MIPAFSIARLPRIEFGRGSFARLPGLIAGRGRRVLLVTGAASVQATPYWQTLLDALNEAGLHWRHCTVSGEPSPALVDTYVQQFAGEDMEVVVGIGGGSVLDAAKAIAGLLRVGRSVMDYLEGVGPELAYEGPALPFIAVPTTAGTGSEATRNAVLSVAGEEGFKKSFRHEDLVAEYAVVDPVWLDTCPPSLIAANGMDALTQLLESWVSTRANPLTDALNLEGLRVLRDSLLPWYRGEAGETEKDGMAYAALLSGITLAQTGLGSVHGLAAPLGAFFPIPHGVACGTLVAEATEINIQALRLRAPDSPALAKYARVAGLLCRRSFDSPKQAHHALIELLRGWCAQMKLPRLSEFGMQNADIDRVVANSRGSSMQTNPVRLEDAEIMALLERRL
ncbi:MAG TPA: iron-containing alcohol dehydrogenase [Gammaproteobacteria bacterium]|nr:iron-containing alcohol dehydrogenase [Gammaproteobacteria bacterium]